MNKKGNEANFLRRRKIIGVMGSSPDYPELTEPLGRLIAGLGHHLLTGAGGGVMAGVSKSFFDFKKRKGVVLGIIRADPNWAERQKHNPPDYKPNKVNDWVEIPIYTQLPLSSADLNSRNHINALTSDVIIALPGGKGTESEVELALKYGTPVIFFLGGGNINGNSPADYIKKFPNSPASTASDITEVKKEINKHISAISK